MKQAPPSGKQGRKAVTPKPAKRPASVGKQALAAPASGKAFPEATTDDAAILDRARMQWQFGDWQSLATLNRQTVEQHPQRAMLALLVGAAHQQLDDHASARSFVSVASEWGCDTRTIARVLIAGVSNTLGRIAAVRQQETRALTHFRAAVDGVGGDARLACKARSVSEIARLDLVDQAFRMIKLQGNPRQDTALLTDRGGEPERIGAARMTPLRDRLLDVPHGPSREERTSGRGIATSATAGIHPAIVIAGMRHSGSTALFNIIRLALEQRGVDFVAFYSEGVQSERLHDPDCPLLLIKTHEFRDDVASRASMIITTRRDLRDTVASAKRRKFPIYDQLRGAREYAKYNRALHDIWQPCSDYEFVYERYMAVPLVEIRRLFRFMGLDGIDAEAIQSKVSCLPVDQYQTTLLSPTHITDPEQVLSFQNSLAETDVCTINRDHGAWLSRYGYEPVSVRP